ncbi:MAG: Grx4 family monothiol glutaredoxin [Nannocystaceae bacterium]
MSDDAEKFIDHLVRNNRVILFMKGNKMFPQCGFSAAVLEILKRQGVPFEVFNVLTDPAVREGVKRYSEWPTIPQLYIGGEFIGGCDIVREMDANGELADKLQAARPAS